MRSMPTVNFVANDRLHQDSSLADHTGLSPDQVTNLLRFYLNATYLAYSGKFYKQTFGTAMGWGPPCRSQWQT